VTRSLQAAGESEHSRLIAAEAALAELSRRELDAPGELDVAEVDYLLRLANERLTLFGDTQAADRALALADSHLAAMDNPAYLVVRQEISAARRKLASVDAPDPVDVASRIDTLQEAIPGLPFRGGEALDSGAAEADGSSWWERLKSTLAGLVTIRRSTAEENLELSLEDKDFVRQRLWMQLEAAHLALLRRDEDAFRDALTRARKTVATWFEPGSGAVQSFDGGLAELAGTSLRADLPDISGPWSTLRLLRGGGTSQPPADAGGGAEPPGGDAAATGDGAG
jgi:uroporphyrin-3 C-methyltransferase